MLQGQATPYVSHWDTEHQKATVRLKQQDLFQLQKQVPQLLALGMQRDPTSWLLSTSHWQAPSAGPKVGPGNVFITKSQASFKDGVLI